MLSRDVCYAALKARDTRFDGRLFVGVTSTGIYCRPICPASPAKPEHCIFFASAAAAQEAGFRPCLRCRPECAPDTGPWRGTSNTVSRGLALIAEGALDDASVEELAERLGVGSRQLRRLFARHLGASPLAVAQTARVLLAKQLIHETRLPMAEIALAAGFGSVRRFNETFQKLFARPPSALRRERAAAAAAEELAGGFTVMLRYRPPYDWPAMIAHLAARAIPGVERVDAVAYRRTVRVGGQVGAIEVRHHPEALSLAATIRFPSILALSAIVARIRRVFDLGADIVEIESFLARDPLLAPLIARRPGLRSPGGWDGFEVAVRAILGQQVSLIAGRKLGEKLVQICGPAAETEDPELSRAFPGAHEIAGADLTRLGMPAARRNAIQALARAAIEDPHLFDPRASLDATIAKLCAIDGIGEWTAHTIALRGARDPDAFPASDVGLLRGAQNGDGSRPRPAQLVERAERWRPWRGYAAQHLWAADSAPVPARSEP